MWCPIGPNTLNVSNHPTSRTHLYAVRHILQYVTPAAIGMWYTMRRKGNRMGLVKTRRLAAMQKQQRAILLRQGYGGLKAGMRPPCKDRKVPVPRAKFSSDPRRP